MDPLYAVLIAYASRARYTALMFEEAQLYSPVTANEDGDGHRRARQRPPRRQRSRLPRAPQRDRRPRARAGSPGDADRRGSTTPRPSTRSGGSSAASSRPSTSATPAATSARRAARLALPTDRIPQLDEVSARPASRSPASATTPPPGSSRCATSSARSATASSTRRSTSATGGAALHARARPHPRGDRPRQPARRPRFAAIKREAGLAAQRVETDEALQFLADVFWFTIEFGVLREEGEVRAYGAGILSSYGEIEEFRARRPAPARPARDGHAGVRHHPLPAGAVLRRRDGRAGGRRRRILRAFDDDSPARLRNVARAA